MTPVRRLSPSSLLPPLFLLLLPTLLLWRVVFGGQVFLPADLLRDIAPWRAANPAHQIPWNPLLWDSMAEFYPWRLFAAHSLRHGWLPLWNPHQLCGTPFVANSQSAVFYPLNLLFVVLPVARAFGVSVWLHLALTGLFFYGYARSGAWSLSPPAALLGAVAWQLSAWQISWLALPTFLCVSCWLPLALWLTWRATAPKAGASRWAALGVCLGVMILGGHLQIALYCLGLVAAYAAFLLWPQRHLPWGIALAGAMALGLAAPQALPAIELARVSHRAGTPTDWAGYQSYVSLAVPALNLITLWLPGFYGNPTQGTYWGAMANGGPSAYMENACSVGVLALALAVLGMAATWRTQRQTRFFGIAALVALAMALGTPLDALPYFGIPGFSQSASPGRILVLWTFCAALLAATGAEAFLSQAVTRRTAWGAGAAFIGATIAAIGGTLAWIAVKGPDGVLAFNLPRVGDLWRVPLGILLGAGALIWLRGRRTLTTSVTGYGLSILAALELLAAGLGYNHTVPLSAVYPVTPGLRCLQQHAGTDRVLALNRSWSLNPDRPPDALMPPNTATVYGLNDIAGYDSLLTRRSLDFVAALDGGQDPAPPENGNMMFTRAYATPPALAADDRFVVAPTPLADPTLSLVAQDGEEWVYQNPRALPRARLAAGQGTATLRDVAPTRVAVQVTGMIGAAGAELIVADQWMPGWRAWVNGRPTPISLEGGMFRRIALPPGSQARVEMRYLPTTFRISLYGFCLAFAAALGVAAGGLRRSRHG